MDTGGSKKVILIVNTEEERAKIQKKMASTENVSILTFGEAKAAGIDLSFAQTSEVTSFDHISFQQPEVTVIVPNVPPKKSKFSTYMQNKYRERHFKK